jgi:hypothetical protein
MFELWRMREPYGKSRVLVAGTSGSASVGCVDVGVVPRLGDIERCEIRLSQHAETLQGRFGFAEARYWASKSMSSVYWPTKGVLGVAAA